MRSAILVLLLSSALAAADDTSINKTLHVLGGSGISMIAGYSTGHPWVGFASGCGAGMAKEVSDHLHGEHWAANARDAAITCGAAAGSWWLVRKMVQHDKRRWATAGASTDH